MKVIPMLIMIAIFILLVLVGCNQQTNLQKNESDAAVECEDRNGLWVEHWDCCCPSKCLNMTDKEMFENYELCECCVIE